jgi:hypothetical protein
MLSSCQTMRRFPMTAWSACCVSKRLRLRSSKRAFVFRCPRRAGAAALCAWGEASAAHFRTVAPATNVHVTGNPRFDGVEPSSYQEAGRALAARLGLTTQPLLYLSNTIDDMGFCSTAEKMEIFSSFLRKVKPLLARDGRALVVKLHPREDVAAFSQAATIAPPRSVHILRDESLYPILAMGKAAVVLASTVGIEALMFGLPLGVLAIPRYGHVFEYVRENVAIALDDENVVDGVGQLLTSKVDQQPVGRFLERHLACRGQAAARTADRITDLLQRSAL